MQFDRFLALVQVRHLVGNEAISSLCCTMPSRRERDPRHGFAHAMRRALRKLFDGTIHPHLELEHLGGIEPQAIETTRRVLRVMLDQLASDQSWRYALAAEVGLPESTDLPDVDNNESRP